MAQFYHVTIAIASRLGLRAQSINASINTTAFAATLRLPSRHRPPPLAYPLQCSLIQSLGLEKGGKAALRTPNKVLLENPNLYHAVATETGFQPNPGTLREIFFVNALRGSGAIVHYSKEGDYRAKGKVFEIGGDGKSRRQLKDLPGAILVKDGSMTAAPGEIPLYLFGFLW